MTSGRRVIAFTEVQEEAVRGSIIVSGDEEKSRDAISGRFPMGASGGRARSE